MDGISTPDTTHTILWPDVRKYIQRKGRIEPGKKAPIALCGLCQDSELDILGLPLSGETVCSMKPAMITVCGHMACNTCLDAWYRTCIEQGRQVTCPFCRHVLHFKCKHKITGFLLPTISDLIPSEFFSFSSYLSHVPLTLPEGGRQPDECNGCRRFRLTNYTLEGAGVIRAKLAETFALDTSAILGRDFTSGFLWATQKGLLEVIQNGEDAEHPSWGTQWDKNEVRCVW